MSKLKYYTLFFMLGGISYWFSSNLITSIFFRPSFIWVIIWVMLLTFMVPFIVILVYLYTQKRIGNQFNVDLPLLMLLGIWLIAPLGISVSLTLMGGEFLNSKVLLNSWAMLPIFVFIGSGYSGNIGGFFLTTIFFLLFYVDEKRKLNKSTEKINRF